MSAVVYKPVDDGSAFYRLVEPARVTNTPVVERLPQVGSADTVILNRPLDPGIAEQIRLWREEGRTVIVDMDDDFDAVVPGHRIHGKYTTEYLHKACEAASLVTCSTPALRRRYGYGHGVVLRNRIPESYLSVTRRTRIDLDGKPAADGTWVGWYGSLGSHPNDPAAAGRAVGDAINPDSDAQFVFIGPDKDLEPLREIFGLGSAIGLGFYSLVSLPQILSEFDVGIVPLEQSSFNDAKSALKGLEFAAVGVPVVASPTPEYQRVARSGGCATAASPADWRSWLEDLIRDPLLRSECATRGRAWAATQTVEQHADDWRTVWYSRDHATL